ncbi:MAG: helix-turn-helix domain-containing protein [Lachnospiraceae bacterium]|nr:helix-turn-helix domain-containing protein [Lachnospiraceae bacterium]
MDEQIIDYPLLKFYRKRAGLSVKAAAEKIAVSQSTLRKWEQKAGSTETILIDQLNELCYLYGITLNDITMTGIILR